MKYPGKGFGSWGSGLMFYEFFLPGTCIISVTCWAGCRMVVFKARRQRAMFKRCWVGGCMLVVWATGIGSRGGFEERWIVVVGTRAWDGRHKLRELARCPILHVFPNPIAP